MPASIKAAVADLGKKVAELYRELVTNTVKFEELRKFTRETIDDYRRLLERYSDKLDRLSEDRIKSEAELTSRIHALEARLNALSEQALHAAAREAAIQVMREGYRPPLPPREGDEQRKQLPPGEVDERKQLPSDAD